MTIKTYDPKQVVVTINGIEIKGFTDGTFIELEELHVVPGDVWFGEPGDGLPLVGPNCRCALTTLSAEALNRYFFRLERKARRAARMRRIKRRGWA